MWWLIVNAPDFWVRGPGSEPGFSQTSTMILMRCRIIVLLGRKTQGGKPTPEAKTDFFNRSFARKYCGRIFVQSFKNLLRSFMILLGRWSFQSSSPLVTLSLFLYPGRRGYHGLPGRLAGDGEAEQGPVRTTPQDIVLWGALWLDNGQNRCVLFSLLFWL